MDNAPETFTAAQLRVFLHALINLDLFDFAEDVAGYFVSDDENNQQTPDEILASTLISLPDEKLTSFALRLVLTGHTDIPRESDFDFLAEAESVFATHKAKKKVAAKRTDEREPTVGKPQSASNITAKKSSERQKPDCSVGGGGSAEELPLFLLESRAGKTSSVSPAPSSGLLDML